MVSIKVKYDQALHTCWFTSSHEIGDGQIHPTEGQILMQNTGQLRLSTAYLLVHQEIGDGQIHTVTQTI